MLLMMFIGGAVATMFFAASKTTGSTKVLWNIFGYLLLALLVFVLVGRLLIDSGLLPHHP